ncbi:hypothetical protein [Kitasatospora sp. NPDC088783]|uniref:hypothetical protein n=1 Tax=Kitasatospora sp. NPDC088783 TaxID=3364077 RepID=UPI0037F5EB0F
MFKSTATGEITSAVTAAFPGLRQVAPPAWGSGPAEVRIDRDLTARYACGEFTVYVRVGQADHLSGDPEDESLQRRIDAHADMLMPTLLPVELPTGEWVVPTPVARVHYPVACIAAADALTAPAFADAVLAVVAQALHYAVAVAGQAAQAAADLAEEAGWVAECPPGRPVAAYVRERGRERDRARREQQWAASEARWAAVREELGDAYEPAEGAGPGGDDDESAEDWVRSDVEPGGRGWAGFDGEDPAAL